MSDIISRSIGKIIESKIYKDTVKRLLVEEIELQLKKEAGGMDFYIAKGCDNLKRAERNKKICSMYNGGNLEKVAKEFNLTTRQVRNICKENEK